MANNELLDKVLNHIKTNPETWDQSNWRCGTNYCFAGHAAILGGWRPVDDEDNVPYWKLVGFDTPEAHEKDIHERYKAHGMDGYGQLYFDSLLKRSRSIVPNTSDIVTLTGYECKSISLVAQELLEINEYTADELFSGSNDLHDLEDMVKAIKERGELGHYGEDCPGEDGCNECY